MDSGVVIVKWGHDEISFPRTDIVNLEGLKEQLENITGINASDQSLFHNSCFLSSEEKLADAIESPNPVLYIHSRPPIRIYLKFGWILKSLDVFVFFSVGYLRYVSMDVLSSVYGGGVSDMNLHLILNGKVLEVDEMSVYDAGMVSGSIVEICLSDSANISEMYDCISGLSNPLKRNSSLFVLDSSSLLSSRLLFSELSGGKPTISLKLFERYCTSVGLSVSSLPRWVGVLNCGENLNENAFIVLYQLLLHDLEFAELPSSLEQLLSIPLSPLSATRGDRLSEDDLENVIPYNSLLNSLQVLSQVGFQNLWHMPLENVRDLLYQFDGNKEMWDGLISLVVTGEVSEMNVCQFCVLIYLSDKRVDSVPSSLGLPLLNLLRCSYEI